MILSPVGVYPVILLPVTGIGIAGFRMPEESALVFRTIDDLK